MLMLVPGSHPGVELLHVLRTVRTLQTLPGISGLLNELKPNFFKRFQAFKNSYCHCTSCYSRVLESFFLTKRILPGTTSRTPREGFLNVGHTKKTNQMTGS